MDLHSEGFSAMGQGSAPPAAQEDSMVDATGENVPLQAHDTSMGEADMDVVPPGGGLEGATSGPLGLDGTKPDPVDVGEFFKNPFAYNPEADILHATMNSEGDTPLYIAAKQGFGEAVRVLLGSRKVQVNVQNHKGITPVSVAGHKNRVEIVKMLIAARADVNIESNNGSTPLIQASHFGHQDVVRLLLAAGAMVDRPNNKGTTALMRATQEGNEAVALILIEAGADVSRRNAEKMNALMLGSQRGHANIVKALIEHSAEVDGQTAQGSTALMLACKRGHLGCVKVLLAAGAEIHMKDSRNRTAKETAFRRMQKQIVDLLHPSMQIRLIQDNKRDERTSILSWLYHRTQVRRTFRVEEKHSEGCPSMRVLAQTLHFPQPVFERIAAYMPLPRLWDSILVKLRRRCHIDAHEALCGAFELIDEIFTDLNLTADKNQTGHLVRISMSEQLGDRLTRVFGMPHTLLAWVTQWSDVQSVLIRINKGASFSAPVAVQVVHLASEVHKWYRALETGTEYLMDHTAAQTFMNMPSSAYEDQGQAGPGPESDSSDGEMEG